MTDKEPGYESGPGSFCCRYLHEARAVESLGHDAGQVGSDSVDQHDASHRPCVEKEEDGRDPDLDPMCPFGPASFHDERFQIRNAFGLNGLFGCMLPECFSTVG